MWLVSRPLWEAYSAPQILSWNKGGLLLRKGEKCRKGKDKIGNGERGRE